MELHWVGLQEIEPTGRERAERRLRRLAEERDDLIDIRVVGRTTRHHRHGEQEVRITCQARGCEVVAARTRPDLSLALEDAVEVFEREVHRLRERRAEHRKHG